MATLRPFRAYRPPSELAVKVASPPYDVINTEEARGIAKGNSASFLHVSRPEVDLPDGTDEHSDLVYAQGQRNLAKLIAAGSLIQDAEPSFYVYAQTMGDHRQVGLVACASVAEYERGEIKKHEKTRPDKEDDRTRHIQELRAHDEPVFLTYRARPEIDRLLEAVMREKPVYDFHTGDGVGHWLWMVGADETQAIERAFASVDALYVADGHHRSAAAARVHQALAGDGGDHDVFLSVVFPDEQMFIMAYNRVVRDPKGRTPAELLAEIGKVMDLEPATDPIPDSPLTYGVYTEGRWYRASVRSGTFDASDPVASLDASVLQDQILAPVFGVNDPRRDAHIDFVGGIRGPEALAKSVDDGDFVIAFYLFPTRVDQLLAVSDAGRLMPPKSTWFEPKLRSGLFVHVF